MKRTIVLLLAGLLAAVGARAADQAAQSPEWSINATVIEACSCPMFCQCYFNTKPAAHGHDERLGGFQDEVIVGFPV